MPTPVPNAFSVVPVCAARPPEKKLRVAVVGCGANAAINHLPAIAAAARVEAAVLVDTAGSRAEQLARKYKVSTVLSDYRAIEDSADAAIVALPNHLHAAATIDLLNRGMHVLVEKPMALTTSDCDAMIEAAARSGRTLAVGLEFRFFSDARFIRRFLSEGLLGRINHFDLRTGIVFDWPLESNYLFDKEKSGGGVLMDLGIHVIDLLLWWLGDCATVNYADDSCGGVESNCEIQLEFAGGAHGTVELSRTRNLRNSCIFDGERGRLAFETWSENPQFRLELNGHESYLAGCLGGERLVRSCESAFERQIDDFAEAIQSGREPVVNGREGRRAIQFIERCYQARRPLRLPWSF
jgi:predicted dehydrogenase